MKYYKITLEKEGTKLVYPENYQTEIGDFALDHLYYDDGFTSMLLLVLPNKVKNIIRKNVEEITETEAKAISDSNETRVETIKDEAKLRRLELKATLGQPLTAEEENNIDINHPDSIFKVSENLSDRIDILKTK